MINAELTLESAIIINGLLRTEISNIEKEQDYWQNQPELVHVADSLEERLGKVEILQMEFETFIEFEKQRLESVKPENKDKT